MRIFAAKQARAVALVIAAAALPRLAVLALERGSILTAYTEKSDDFAQTFVASGTFGFVAGHPSASTQPVYSFFLIPLYWLFGRSWEVVGIAQIVLAAITAVLVYFIGRLVVPRLALLAAAVSTLNPYLIWHDVHVNREITDQVLLAGIVLVALLAIRRTSWKTAVALGALAGLAILGNSRLALLPLVLAAFVWFRSEQRRILPALVIVVVAGIVVAPWMIRNEVSVGCFTITTDARALWKANNALTYDTLATGKWIDDVPQPASFPPTPEDVASIYRQTGHYIPIDECAQMRYFEHLTETYVEHHPAEKAKLALQATTLLWDPRVHETQGRPGKGTWRDVARRIVEPIWAIPVMLLAAAGLFLAVDRAFVLLAGSLLLYNTFAAMVFAGTTRYRVPFDFLLVLLAAGAVERLWSRSRYTASTPSAAAPAEN
jgi:4-amino-4-deoxy-L-arabinose transferase-like glycosyltransferase